MRYKRLSTRESIALLRAEIISLSRLFFHTLCFEIIVLKDKIIRIVILRVIIREVILSVKVIIF